MLLRFNAVQEDSIDENGFLYSYSECGSIAVFIMPVLYGFRVRATYTSNPVWCELDYCAGDRYETVQALYTLVVRALERTGGDFTQFPAQEIRPFPFDVYNFAALAKLAGVFDSETFPVIEFGADLHQYRQQYFQQLYSGDGL